MKYLSLILILLTLFSCEKDNSFIVKGKVLNKESGIVRLNQIGENSFDAKICELNNGEFYFKDTIELPEEFFIQYKENEKSRKGSNFYKFFVEPGSQTEIVLNTEDINKSEFKGSKAGNEFYKLKQKIDNEFDFESKNLNTELRLAFETNDTIRLVKISSKLDSIAEQKRKREINYIRNHPNSYLSANLLYEMQFKLEADTVQKYFDKLDKNLTESKYYKRLSSFLSIQVGKPFLDFELPDSSGIIHRFSTVAKDKVTLIDFWFSACKPCRENNSKLKQLYKKNKSKGFEVVGISSDRNTSDFIQAINEDEMTWLNLLDKENEESISNIYEPTNTFPYYILIDSKGIIVSRINNFENIELMVNKLINNK